MQVINEAFKEISSKFKVIKELKSAFDQMESTGEVEERDGTANFLQSFFSKAENEVEKLNQKIKGVDEKYKIVVAHFGENLKDLPLETLVDILTKFNKDINVKNRSKIRLQNRQ